MRKILTTTLALLSVTAFSEHKQIHTPSKWYIQGGVNVAQLASLPVMTSGDTWNGGGNLGFGYQDGNQGFGWGFLTQLNYFGQSSSSLITGNLITTHTHQNYSWDLDPTVHYHFTNSSIYLGVGTSYVSQRNQGTGYLNTQSASVDYTSKAFKPNMIAGFRYYFTPKWTVFGQYEHIFAEKEESQANYLLILSTQTEYISSINSITLGLGYDF